MKDITGPIQEIQEDLEIASQDKFKDFLPVLDECDIIQLSEEQLKGLVFVAGYCVTKLIQETCKGCQNQFCKEDKLTVETSNDSYMFIQALDRGGLTWPTDYAVDIVTQIFTVFQVLIGSKKNEKQFLTSGNQRRLLMYLGSQRLADLGLLEASCQQCEKDHCGPNIQNVCVPAVNIFLNNYRKSFTSQTTNKKRKIQTVKKRF